MLAGVGDIRRGGALRTTLRLLCRGGAGAFTLGREGGVEWWFRAVYVLKYGWCGRDELPVDSPEVGWFARVDSMIRSLVAKPYHSTASTSSRTTL